MTYTCTCAAAKAGAADGCVLHGGGTWTAPASGRAATQAQARKLLDWARDHHPDPEALEAMVREREG